MHLVVSLPMVLNLFRNLFGQAWFTAWQEQWKTAQCQKAQGTEAAAKQSKKVRRKSPRRFYERIFSLRVTLWYMLFQRLNDDRTLKAVMMDIRRGGADRLSPDKKRRLSQKIRSTHTTSYNEARQRMPLELLKAALTVSRDGLVKLVGLKVKARTPPPPNQRVRQLVDGSTLSMLRTRELAGEYPPASNQSGDSDWCLMRVVVGFCALSGGILSGIGGAMSCSEQTLIWSLIAGGNPFTVWIGDRNFGVWSVAAQAKEHEQDVLVRMTKARARKLAGRQVWHSGQDQELVWNRSRSDKVAPGVTRTEVRGRLIYVRLYKQGKTIDLWLFTTLLDREAYPLTLLVEWYGLRWQAELHFRSVKTHLKLEQIFVGTPETARKEFYAALLAYSLVRGAMWAAGTRIGQTGISFCDARRAVLQGLKDWGADWRSRRHSTEDWARKLLDEVTLHRLPRRREPRPTEPRMVRHRRMKFPPLKGSRAAARAKLDENKSL
jgi:hypothetical protein